MKVTRHFDSVICSCDKLWTCTLANRSINIIAAIHSQTLKTCIITVKDVLHKIHNKFCDMLHSYLQKVSFSFFFYALHVFYHLNSFNISITIFKMCQNLSFEATQTKPKQNTFQLVPVPSLSPKGSTHNA